jgi:hypothetical protein
MKLRIHRDSLRLRLNRSDVEQFRTSGVCAASLRFESSSQLTYTLETSSQLTVIEVRYLQDCIRVSATARHGSGIGGLRPDFTFP